MLKFRLLAFCASLLPSLAAHAEVIRFEVLQSVPAFEGRSFGSVGPYVKITARATIAVDPADPRNAVIADIDKAPRDESGLVEATADVVLLRPADPLRANGTLLVDVPNRGSKLAPQLFDDAAKPGANDAEKAADAGIGFLHGQGYTMAWIGWQADIPSKPGQLALAAPVLQGVTGPARDEFLFDHTRSPATATLSWPIADPSSLAVTVRAKWDAPREKPAGLAIRATGDQTVEITRPASGFDAGALYEVTYTARDPAVLGSDLRRRATWFRFCGAACDAGKSARRRRRFRPARDRLWRLAVRAIPARFPLSRFQRGPRRRTWCSTG